MKRIADEQLIGQQGINLIEKIVLEMGFIWRPLVIMDAGVDGQIEIRDAATGSMNGTLIHVQSKATQIKFSKETDESFVYRCRADDVEYWLRVNTPVILIVSRPRTNEAYWVSVDELLNAPGHAVTIRKDRNRFDAMAKEALQSLPSDHRTIPLPGTPTKDRLHGYRSAIRDTVKRLSLGAIIGSAVGEDQDLFETFVPLRLVDDAGSGLNSETVFADSGYQYTVLLGGPGSGKSAMLGNRLSIWASLGEGPVPLLIELRRFVQDPVTGIDLIEYLVRGSSCIYQFDRDVLDWQLTNQAGMLLLDGLDEILDRGRRDEVIQQVVRLKNRFPRVSIILTSRIIGYRRGELRSLGFRELTIQPFDNGQKQLFVERWHARMPAATAEELKHRLVAAMKEDSVNDLANSPMLLTLLAKLNGRNALPRTRTLLLSRAADLLLHEWDGFKSISQPTGLRSGLFNHRDKNVIMQRLAVKIQEGRSRKGSDSAAANLIDEAEIRDTVLAYINGLGLHTSAECASAIIQYAQERNGILNYLGSDSYAFVHRMFLEFFVAQALSETTTSQLLADPTRTREGTGILSERRLNDESWHEIVVVLCGVLPPRDAAALIQQIDSLASGPWDQGYHALAAECLLEVSDEEVRKELERPIIDHVQCAFNYRLPGEHAFCGFRANDYGIRYRAIRAWAKLVGKKRCRPECECALEGLKRIILEWTDDIAVGAAIDALIYGWGGEVKAADVLSKATHREDWGSERVGELAQQSLRRAFPQNVIVQW
jgi:hypothetical protein